LSGNGRGEGQLLLRQHKLTSFTSSRTEEKFFSAATKEGKRQGA